MAIDFNMRVLIVDDYSSMRHIIRNYLKQLNFYNIVEASNGKSALLYLSEKNFGLVISDWHMAPTNGLELLQTVRADEEFKNLPFIMVTAEWRTDYVISAKEAGVSNYIIKPFNLPTLKAKLSSVLGDF